MSENRKTRAGTAIPMRAVEKKVLGGTTISIFNSTISAADSQTFRVADLLLHGAENAIPRRQLMSLTGCRDRELRLLIEAERRQGCPILSDNIHGYFLPGDESERERCVRSLRRRAAEIMETAAAIEEAEV